MMETIKMKMRKKYNTKQNQIDSLKEENRKLLKKISEKDELIINLFYLRDELVKEKKELLDELTELREKKVRKNK